MPRVLLVIFLLVPFSAQSESSDIETRLQQIEKRLAALEHSTKSLANVEMSMTIGSAKPGEISADYLRNVSSNQPLLLTQVRGVPYFQQGKAVGLRLFAIKPGGLFDQIGLQNGDVIISVDGTPILDLVTLARALTPPVDDAAKAIKIQLIRLDQPMPLNIAVTGTKP